MDDRINNPWCDNCKEKDCTVSSDGTCEMIRKYLSLTSEVERLKAENEKLKDALRPVALIGNRLMSTGSLNKYEFLSPSGYRKAYETYSEVTK